MLEYLPVIHEELVVGVCLRALPLALHAGGVDVDEAGYARLEPATRPAFWEVAAASWKQRERRLDET